MTILEPSASTSFSAACEEMHQLTSLDTLRNQY